MLQSPCRDRGAGGYHPSLVQVSLICPARTRRTHHQLRPAGAYGHSRNGQQREPETCSWEVGHGGGRLLGYNISIYM